MPIQRPYKRHEDLRYGPYGPSKIPWAVLAPHEAQALKNHSQTLEQLANRGGLGPEEAYCIYHDMGYQYGDQDLHEKSMTWLEKVLQDFP